MFAAKYLNGSTQESLTPQGWISSCCGARILADAAEVIPVGRAHNGLYLMFQQYDINYAEKAYNYSRERVISGQNAAIKHYLKHRPDNLLPMEVETLAFPDEKLLLHVLYTKGCAKSATGTPLCALGGLALTNTDSRDAFNKLLSSYVTDIPSMRAVYMNDDRTYTESMLNGVKYIYGVFTKEQPTLKAFLESKYKDRKFTTMYRSPYVQNPNYPEQAERLVFEICSVEE